MKTWYGYDIFSYLFLTYSVLDIDECAEGLVTCPTDQECKNTFGNFLCVCKDGKTFQFIEGKYQCVGMLTFKSHIGPTEGSTGVWEGN